MAAMDELNARFGRGTVFMAAIGVTRGWKLRAAIIHPVTRHASPNCRSCRHDRERGAHDGLDVSGAFLRDVLHRSEQYLTLLQSFAHFLRHVNGRPQAAQIFSGRNALRCPLGISSDHLRFPLWCTIVGATGCGVKVSRLFAHPIQKSRDLRVGSQALDIRQMAGELRFGAAGMDRTMADLVQPCGNEMGAPPLTVAPGDAGSPGYPEGLGVGIKDKLLPFRQAWSKQRFCGEDGPYQQYGAGSFSSDRSYVDAPYILEGMPAPAQADDVPAFDSPLA